MSAHFALNNILGSYQRFHVKAFGKALHQRAGWLSSFQSFNLRQKWRERQDQTWTNHNKHDSYLQILTAAFRVFRWVSSEPRYCSVYFSIHNTSNILVLSIQLLIVICNLRLLSYKHYLTRRVYTQ